jgi:parallel beta-helix repeat protein
MVRARLRQGRVTLTTRGRTGAVALCILALGVGGAEAADGCTVRTSPGDDVQAAVDGAAGGSGPAVVCLSAGEFRLRRFVSIRRDGVVLRGEGDATVLRLDRGVASPVVVVGDQETERPRRPTSDVTIERLRVVGGGGDGPEHHPDHPFLTNSAIVVRAGRRVAIRDVDVSACRSACILTEFDTRDVAIERNRVAGSVWDGISLNRTATARIVDNVIRHNAAAGITVEHLEDSVLEGNVVADNRTHGLYLADSYRNRFLRNRLADNVLSGVFLTCSVRDRTPPVACWDGSMSQANAFSDNELAGNRVGFTIAADARAPCTAEGFLPNRSRGDRFARNPPGEPYPAAFGLCLAIEDARTTAESGAPLPAGAAIR